MAKSIESLNSENGLYYFTYSNNVLFNLLEAAIGADTVLYPAHPNVVRYFDNSHPMQILITAGGDELYNYIQVNSQTGYSQTVPDYTNIYGGFGVFSSRINLTKNVSVSSATQIDLYGKPWGFVQQ